MAMDIAGEDIKLVTQTFEITDIHLAVTLKCLGFQYVGLQSKEKNRKAFIFTENEDKRAVIDNYYNRKISVDALTYKGHFEMLKDELFGQR
jgi:hypothetical protein